MGKYDYPPLVPFCFAICYCKLLLLINIIIIIIIIISWFYLFINLLITSYSYQDMAEWFVTRVVIKSRGPGIFPGYYECGPWLLLLENRRKIEPNKIPRCLISPPTCCIYLAAWNLSDSPVSLLILKTNSLEEILWCCHWYKTSLTESLHWEKSDPKML